MTTGRERTEYERVEYGPGTTAGQSETRMREEGQQAAYRVRAEGEQTAYRAREQGEQVKQTVASQLHTAAEKLRGQAHEGGQANLAYRVADPLDRSAQYLGSHSLPQIGSDIRRSANEHPVWAAAGVFATAFLVGRLLRRR